MTEFIDYYALLGVPCTATAQEIRQHFLQRLATERPQGIAYDQLTEAYALLRNRYKRARYDRKLGFLLVLQPQPEPYPNAVVYSLNSIQPFMSLQRIIHQFQGWIVSHYDLTWEEAQRENYSYHLALDTQNPRLILRFRHETDRKQFIEQLISTRMIVEKIS